MPLNKDILPYLIHYSKQVNKQKTIAVPIAKPSTDDDMGLKYGFVGETSLSNTNSTT